MNVDLAILRDVTYLFALLAGILFAIAGFTAFRKGFKRYEEKYLSKTAQDLDEMFLPVSPEQFLYINVLITFLLGLAGLVLSAGDFVVAFLCAIVGFLIPRFWLNYKKKKRLKMFEEQMVDALTTMANSLKAGFSLVQTFEMVAKEMNPPISEEFGLMLRENKLGVHLDKALLNMTKRVRSNNLDLVVTSTIIARTAGGNLAEIFTTIASTIREISRLEGKIDALTAQGKWQGAVLGIIPILLAVAIYFIDPSYITILVEDVIGWIMIGLIIIFEALGFFFIRKIATIDI